MDQSLVQTSEYVSRQEDILAEANAIKERKQEAHFKEKGEAYGAEYDEQFGQSFVAPVKKNSESRREYAARVGKYEKAFGEQQSIDRNSYISKRVSQYKSGYTRDEERELSEKIAIMKEGAASNPMHQQNLNAMRNFKDSNSANTSVPEYMSLVLSDDTNSMALAAQSRKSVLNNFTEATATDKETLHIKEASIIMTKEDAIRDRKKHSGVIRNEADLAAFRKAFPKESYKKGYIGKKEEAKLAHGDDSVLDKAVEEREKVGLIATPEEYAKEFTKESFKAAGKELSDKPIEAVIDDNGKSAFYDKELSKRIVSVFNELKDDDTLTFQSRDKTILTRALEQSGITPDSVGQYQYQNFVKNGYSLVHGLRDASFNTAATMNSMNTKVAQAKAYDFVVSKVHEFAVQSMNNPEALEGALKKSNGTSDAMLAMTLLGAEGRMDAIKSIASSDFEKEWGEGSKDSRFALFTDKVFDHLMDATRFMKPKEQRHAMSVINKLRNTNSKGQLGMSEPVVANEMNTLFKMFNESTGVKFDEKAKEAEHKRIVLGQRTATVGNKKYTVSNAVHAQGTQQHSKATKRGDDVKTMIEVIPSTLDNLKIVGAIKDGNIIDADSASIRTVMDVTMAEQTEDGMHEVAVSMQGTPAMEAFSANYNNVGLVSEDGFKAAKSGSDSLVVVTKDSYLKDAFNATKKNPQGLAAYNAVMSSDDLRSIAYSLDGKKVKAAYIVGLQRYNDTINGKARVQASNIIYGDRATDGLINTVGLPSDISINEIAGATLSKLNGDIKAANYSNNELMKVDRICVDAIIDLEEKLEPIKKLSTNAESVNGTGGESKLVATEIESAIKVLKAKQKQVTSLMARDVRRKIGRTRKPFTATFGGIGGAENDRYTDRLEYDATEESFDIPQDETFGL